jgi:SSS family solute:Na+ symporter
MLVGVVSTQTYIQAILTSRDVIAARRGALISAVMIPPLGLLGIAVGLFMRQSQPTLDSARALPVFIMEQLSAPLAGIAFATLLIAAVATASGLTLGVGTTLQVDILSRFERFRRHELAMMRLVTLGVILVAGAILLSNLDAAIMQWSFLSMGLRGATLCLPLLAAILLHDRTTRRGGAWSIYLAPLAVMVTGLAGLHILPPLMVGLLVSLGAMVLGGMYDHWTGSPQHAISKKCDSP